MRFRSFGVRAGVAAAAVVVVAAVAAGAAVADAQQTPGEVLQDSLTTELAKDKLPGLIGMVRDGDSTAYAKAGWGDQFMRVPADPQAQFRIGSNTKAFTAVVLLQLEAEGKLSLDDTVDKWLPGAVSANGNDGTKITVRQLLNQTSGLKDYDAQPEVEGPYIADLDPNQRWDPQQLVDIATAQAPYGDGKWHYSNTNYVLAGMIIKAVTGNDPQTEVENRIIKPLGLTHTTFPVTDSKLYGNWLHGYYYVRDISFSNVQVFNTAGSIVSTLDDLTTFESALFSGRLLDTEQQKELETTVPMSDTDTGGYGLGVGKVETRCGTAYTHTGAVLGYESVWISTPSGSRVVAVATNEFNMVQDSVAENIYNAAQDAFCA